MKVYKQKSYIRKGIIIILVLLLIPSIVSAISFKSLTTITGSSPAAVYVTKFNNGGDLLAYGGEVGMSDATITIVNSDWEIIYEDAVGELRIVSCAWSPNDQALFVGTSVGDVHTYGSSYDDETGLWSWSTGGILSGDGDNSTNSIDFSNQYYVAAGSDNHNVTVLDNELDFVTSFNVSNKAIISLDFNNRGSLLAVGTTAAVYIISTTDWSLSETITVTIGEGPSLSSLEFSNDDNFLAIGTSDYIRIFNTATWTEAITIYDSLEDDYVFVAWNPTDTLLAYSGELDTNGVVIINTTNYKMVTTIYNATDLVTSLSFSNDYLAIGSIDDKVYLLEIIDNPFISSGPTAAAKVVMVEGGRYVDDKTPIILLTIIVIGAVLYTGLLTMAKKTASEMLRINPLLTIIITFIITAYIINNLQVTNLEGGGGGDDKETIIQEVKLASFCGDGTCDDDENPLRCNQDCSLDLDNSLSCLMKDPLSCIYNKQWFLTLMIIFLIITTIYFTNKINKKRR